MGVFLCFAAYAAIFACAAVMVKKIAAYRRKPVHLRWELYPVPHETGGRAEYGGSYLENACWWQNRQRGSLAGTLKGFLKEALLLHATREHNPGLWRCSYPFHVGLYLVVGSLGLTLLCALMSLGGYSGWFFLLCFHAGFFCGIAGCAGVLGGCVGLLLRRLKRPDLRKFSMPEHFFNLGLFIAFAALGLLRALLYGSDSMRESAGFFAGMLSFRPVPVSPLYALSLLLCCFLFVWVPYSFMGHAFMKYFTWHDIRWGDQPSQDSQAIRDGMAKALRLPVSWRAPHIGGDGRKNWADVATANPARQDKE